MFSKKKLKRDTFKMVKKKNLISALLKYLPNDLFSLLSLCYLMGVNRKLAKSQKNYNSKLHCSRKKCHRKFLAQKYISQKKIGSQNDIAEKRCSEGKFIWKTFNTRNTIT